MIVGATVSSPSYRLARPESSLPPIEWRAVDPFRVSSTSGFAALHRGLLPARRNRCFAAGLLARQRDANLFRVAVASGDNELRVRPGAPGRPWAVGFSAFGVKNRRRMTLSKEQDYASGPGRGGGRSRGSSAGASSGDFDGPCCGAWAGACAGPLLGA